MPVSAVFENFEAGATVHEIAEWFHLSTGQIVEVLSFAARSAAAPDNVDTISLTVPVAASSSDARYL